MEVNAAIRRQWLGVEQVIRANTERVVEAFRKSGLSSADLMGTTGYGYDDRGRDILDRIFAEIFGADRALVRAQWVSGTHALATALKALTAPRKSLWIMSGEPYDTIRPTLKWLASQDVRVHVRELRNASPDFPEGVVAPGDLVYLQRSRGYAVRPSWGEVPIRRIADWAHAHQALLMVDNCYGEFTQAEEPVQWGADLVVGSLMKNPGGTIAPTGAYVAGRSDLVEQVAETLYAPGIGAEVGPTAPYLRLMAQGLFLAPQMVGEALMGGIYASHAAAQVGIKADPGSDLTDRNDIVVSLELGSAERVVQFCRAIQAWSPVDALASPEPWNMPGYDHPIVMAAGGFVAGASLELSADAPIRPPYRVYLQGGANRWHTILAVDGALASLPS